MNILLILYNFLLLLLYIPAGIAIRFTGIGKNSPHYRQRLGLGLPEPVNGRPSFWLHASSVGEARSLTGIVAQLRRAYPEYNIIVSTFTETGYDVASKELKPDAQFLLPFENPIAVRWLIRKHNIKLVFITDTEIWPNTIHAISRKAPLILLNGRISDKTYATYRKYSFIFRPILACFSQIFAKSAEDSARFKAIGGESLNVTIGGNIKYSIRGKSSVDPEIAKLAARKPIALAASTHAPEEEIFINAAKQFKDKFGLIVIVPRHTKRAASIVKIAENAGFSAGLLSENAVDKEILIIDKFGMLESLYQIADKIFIGGSIADIGGHNVFEALQYGKEAVVGPHTYNFNDIVPLAKSFGMLTTVASENEITACFRSSASNGDFQGFITALKNEQQKYEEKIQGAVKRIIEGGK